MRSSNTSRLRFKTRDTDDKRALGGVGVAIVALLSPATPASAQEAQTAYQEPPDAVADIVDAPVTPLVRLDRDRNWLLKAERPPLRAIADLAEPREALAGIRLNPDNNGPSRPRYYIDLEISPVGDGDAAPVTGLPESPRIRHPQFSPSGEHVAFVNLERDRVGLWVVEVETRRARQVQGLDVNAAYPGRPFRWAPSGDSLWVRKVPRDRGAKPENEPVPTGPAVKESRGREAPARTYQDLLESEHDEALFDYYLRSRIARVGLDLSFEAVGPPGIYASVSPAPGGEHLLVTALRPPYSYAVPYSRFARTIDVWNNRGRRVARIADRDVADDLPVAFDATVTGPRYVTWRPDAAAELVWAETQDGGDPARDVEVRERVYALAAPFRDDPRVLAKLDLRFRGIRFGGEGHALVYERWWDTRLQNVWHVDPDRMGSDGVRTDVAPLGAAGLPGIGGGADRADRGQTKLWSRSFEDRYNDPGSPIMHRDARGFSRVAIRDGALLLAGHGASDDGDRPFLDRLDLDSGETERLWQSESPYYERVLGLFDERADAVITRRETIDAPTNFYVRDLSDGSLTPLTDRAHPLPALRDVQREMITYEREDGVLLSARLFLPPGYDPERDGPLPTVVWAYPREFRSADAAGQISGSPYEFARVSYWRPQYLVTQGYAVIDRAAMPVVGEDDSEPNDTFIEQLVMNARAAVRAGVSRGVTDPERVAIGGHSYGAFMTANVLAHSDIFRAGIARSGAYNRSLTPFGFQREQRTLFEAPELYVQMSPFFHAGGIDAPLLLIHGQEDGNSGTYPMQSERMYSALKGLGKTVRLVMLPEESHGYRARESILHMLHEELSWLDEFVKEAPPPAVASDAP